MLGSVSRFAPDIRLGVARSCISTSLIPADKIKTALVPAGGTLPVIPKTGSPPTVSVTLITE